MRSINVIRTFSLAALLLVCGCSANSGKIEGTKWTSQAASIKGMPLPKAAMLLTFNKDGSFSMTGGPMAINGTYSLGMGDTVTLHMEQALSGQKDHAEKISISGNVLTMTDSDGTAIAFDKSN